MYGCLNISSKVSLHGSREGGSMYSHAAIRIGSSLVDQLGKLYAIGYVFLTCLFELHMGKFFIFGNTLVYFFFFTMCRNNILLTHVRAIFT